MKERKENKGGRKENKGGRKEKEGKGKEGKLQRENKEMKGRKIRGES